MVEDSQNKEKEKDSHGFIELQNSWLSFFSQNKQVILDA